MGYIILFYVLIINMIGFALMGIDKAKARSHKWRIPEAVLFMVALLGGSMGSFVGMFVFRHKTKKWYFVAGMPFIFLLQLLLCLYVNSGLFR